MPLTATTPEYVPHARAERLIAAGRFALAFFSFVAVYLEPSTPVHHQQATYGLLAIYAIYALVVLLATWRSHDASRAWRLFSHGLDLVLFSLFVYFTEGPASPFFIYFVFSLFCATLRFTWRGILLTGVTAMCINATIAILAPPEEYNTTRVIIREAYLGVISALLMYLGLYQQRLRSELAALAAWPRDLGSPAEELLRPALRHAASILGASQLVLFWEESEEPWVYRADWTREEDRLVRLAPGSADGLSDPALCNTSFFVGEGDSILVFDPHGSTARQQARGSLLPSLQSVLQSKSALAASLESEALRAHLFVPGVRSATVDELALTHIVGRLLLATLEQFFFLQQVRQNASAEERLRISRELHDGIVQSLGGVGLQLQAIRSRFPPKDEINERLGQVQVVVENDQRELRSIVRELRVYDPRDGRTLLAEELDRMRQRFALEWSLEVCLEAGPVEIGPDLAQEICRIINESLSNAARHGGARRATVRLAAQNGAVHLSVADDGRGFPFQGRHNLAELERRGEGPRTLKERVRKLRGSLFLQSSSSGATIEIDVPISTAEAG